MLIGKLDDYLRQTSWKEIGHSLSTWTRNYDCWCCCSSVVSLFAPSDNHHHSLPKRDVRAELQQLQKREQFRTAEAVRRSEGK